MVRAKIHEGPKIQLSVRVSIDAYNELEKYKRFFGENMSRTVDTFILIASIIMDLAVKTNEKDPLEAVEKILSKLADESP